VLFDATPVPQELPHEGEPWEPAPAPTSLELAARGVRGLARLPLEAAGRALSAATHPTSAAEQLRESIEGVGEVAWAALNPAPATPLNVPIGPHRRLSFVRNDLADFKRVKDALGGTVNDVVLAVVAGGLRSWLRDRGVRTEGLELRALVPVSIRTVQQRGHAGNRIVAMRGPLPVYVEDPVARLRVVRQAMDGLKESKQAVGAEVISGLEALAPPTILAQASRLQFSTRLFNLLVTNVPGPQFPLYVLGRELLDLFPVAFLPENQALAVAIMSYNGSIDFGLLGDYDAMPDIEELGEDLDESLAELVAAAGPTPRRRRRSAAATRVPGPA
jgi:diacylglycerol O-acyltransferase / wax synthase